MTSIISSHLFDLLVLVLLFGPVAVLSLIAWIDRRSERQIRDEQRMRRAIKAAHKLNLLQHDDQ